VNSKGFSEMKTVLLQLNDIISAENLLAAQEVLGLVAQPKTRWNVGSLIAAVLASTDPACVIAVCPTFLHVGVASSVDPLDLGLINSSNETVFLPSEGTTRTRSITSPQVEYIVTDSVLNSVFISDLMELVAMPTLPEMTISGLLNKIFSYFEGLEIPVDFVVFVDQSTGLVTVLSGEIEYNSLTTNCEDLVTTQFAGGALDGITGEVIFSALLSDDVEPVDPDIVVPVWG
jgi:hypothetical protein